jgi:flagellar motor switch protein FliN/FliY
MSEAATTAIAVEKDAPQWARMAKLECELTVELAIPEFRISDLMRLEKGSVVDSRRAAGSDVPLLVNGTFVAWSEFEVVSRHLAVRVTELG